MKVLLITNIGRALGRVLHNIVKLNPQPTKIIYFIQKGDRGWDPDLNEAYAKVIQYFKMHAVVKDFVNKNALQEIDVPSITDYLSFFESLAKIIEKHKDYNLIYLDCTGLPKFSTAVVTQLAGIYQTMEYKIYPIYNRPRQTSIYDQERDEALMSDEGWGPEQLPFSAIDIKWLYEPDSCAYKVLQAAYSFTKGNTNVSFNVRDLKETLNKSGIVMEPRALGRGRQILLATGVIVSDLTRPKHYALTLLGKTLATMFIKPVSN